MVFEGNGTLTVSDNYMDGIRRKDSLTINSGTYVIETAEYGMKGKDAVEMSGGEIAVTSGSDGIQSNNGMEENRGYVRITGGTMAAIAGKREILAGTLVKVTGGVIGIDAQDGSIYSGRNVRITTGQLTLSIGDNTVHGDNLVGVSGGIITVEQSSEGVGELCVGIAGGTIRINSEDNGINITGKKDENLIAGTLALENLFGGRRGQDGGLFGVTEGAYIRISGGDVKINASGDSIDSNGDLYLESGTVLVEGPTGGGDNALDYDREGSILRGTILAVGSVGMFRTFSGRSSQSILVIYFDEIQAAGSTISMKDSQGDRLAETRVSKAFEALLFSSSELKIEEIYYMEAGGQDIQVAVNSILNQYGGPSGSGSEGIPEDGSGDFEKKLGAGNTSGKAPVVEIQRVLLAETLSEGIHILGDRSNME